MPDPVSIFLQQRFITLWQRLGVDYTPDLATAGDVLIAAYDAQGRAYHNKTHLQDVLQKLDWAREALPQSGDMGTMPVAEQHRLFDTIELALWYHDAVYDAKAADNEAQSRDLLLHDAKKFGLAPMIADAAASLIDLTADHKKASTLEERIMMDCDLSILGAPADIFSTYDRGIRQEYNHIPAPIYKAARRLVLAGFLNQPQIFKTTAFHDRLETAARENLRAATKPPLWQRLIGFKK